MGGDRHKLISLALLSMPSELASEMDRFHAEKVILDFLGRKWASQEPELAAGGLAAVLVLVLEHS